MHKSLDLVVVWSRWVFGVAVKIGVSNPTLEIIMARNMISQMQMPSIYINVEPIKNRVTTCKMTVGIGDVVIWPVLNSPNVNIEIQIDDILAHLTEFWSALMLQQPYPLGLAPIRPSLLRSEAVKRWEGKSSRVINREEDLISNFEEAHNLSLSFAGLFGLPDLWVLRDGADMILESNNQLWRVPFDQTKLAFSETGDRIVGLLLAADRERWKWAAEAWVGREKYSARQAPPDRDNAPRRI